MKKSQSNLRNLTKKRRPRSIIFFKNHDQIETKKKRIRGPIWYFL